MTNDTAPQAPVYRYITTNLLTDEVLAEIPFQGVSYGRTLKSSGSFTGNIPVLPQTRSMDLFESTMPGRTALYVLRNEVCVWGGIIWDSKYNGPTKTLTVSASEFPSYLNRRTIWKNFNLTHECTLTTEGDLGTIRITDDSITDGFVPKAQVYIEFPTESQKVFDGFYRLAGGGEFGPTAATVFTSNYYGIVDAVHRNGMIDMHTTEEHHWKVGMLVMLRAADEFEAAEDIVGDWRVAAVDSLDKTRVVLSGPPGNTNLPEWDEGQLLAYHWLPSGTYEKVKVTTHANTHHFVRYLIESAMADFSTGIFSNAKPSSLGVEGFSSVYRVTANGGWATFYTHYPHGLSEGQPVTIHNVHELLNGPTTVSRVIDDRSFEAQVSPAGNAIDIFVTEKKVEFTSVAVEGRGSNNETSLVRATTAAPHGLGVRGRVDVFSSSTDIRSQSGPFNGTYNLAFNGTGSPTELSYTVDAKHPVLPTTATTAPTFKWGQNKYDILSVQTDIEATTISYEGKPAITPGAALTDFVGDVSFPVKDITFDMKTSKVWVETDGPHAFKSGDQITMSGLQAQHRVWSVDAKSQTPHYADVSFVEQVNFREGDYITFEGVRDSCRILRRRGVNGKAEITLDRFPWFSSGRVVTINDLTDTLNVTMTNMEPGKVSFLTDSPGHTIPVGAKINVAMEYSRLVSSFQIDRYRAIFRTPTPHNFVKGSKARIDFTNFAPIKGTYTILDVTDLEIIVSIDEIEDEDLKKAENFAQRSLGTSTPLISDTHPGSGGAVVSEITASTITVTTPQARNVEVLANRIGNISGPSYLNGKHDILSITGRGVVTLATDYPTGNHATYTYPTPEKGYKPHDTYDFSNKTMGRMSATSNLTGNLQVRKRINAYTIQVNLPSGTLSMEDGYNMRALQTGIGSVASRFNGQQTITVHSPTEFWWSSTAYNYSMSERPAGGAARASLPISALTTPNVTTASTGEKTVSFAMSRPTLNEYYPFGRITATVRPGVGHGTYGPFPGNSSLNFEFENYSMSQSSRIPPTYEGYQLTKVGKALNDYISEVAGFDYRVDVAYDRDRNTFTKKFVFVSNEFPDPPVEGELSPLSRFGADKLVFEHPGNISNYALEQKSSTAATRFFMVGRNPWGVGVPAPYSAATDSDSLSRGWPLLDSDGKNATTYDATVLRNFSKKELSEIRPPQADITITVNGSLQPEVGTYFPGDWCSVVINDDEYISQWMRSDVEPRDTVVVRKIDGYKVKVPDGVAFPETVDLDLIPEWEVDRLGD